MAIFIVNHRTSQAQIQQRYGDASILDVTSKGVDPWIRFSPFYPHGDIPVPFSSGYISASVEGIWQGLKFFESMDVDPSKFTITTMKGIKRSTRRYGNILGPRAGVIGDQPSPLCRSSPCALSSLLFLGTHTPASASSSGSKIHGTRKTGGLTRLRNQ